MEDRTERTQLLRVYVGDHLAGSVAGARLAQRLAKAERDGPDGPRLSTIADDIDADRRTLAALAQSLDLDVPRYKQALAWAGEFAGRLKLNGRLVKRSPLSSVIETEGLLMATRGKLAAWETLRAVLGERPGAAIDLDQLMTRASAQCEVLDELHRAAVERAFGVRATESQPPAHAV